VAKCPKPIGLPQRRVAKLLGNRPNTIGEWIRWAIDDGVLKMVAEHKYSPNKRRSKAASYAFKFWIWPELRLEVSQSQRLLEQAEKEWDLVGHSDENL
jgi:hypothetical protein